LVKAGLQVAALGLTLTAALILGRGNLFLTPKDVINLQYAYAGYNPVLIKSLSAQYADNWIGIILLCLAFITQLLSYLDCSDLRHSGASIVIVILAILFLIVISFRAADIISQKMQRDVEHTLMHRK
jgi:hypothetical protein